MKSCYGFWLLSVCWISLAGCANWQSRAGSMSGPGSAAGLSGAPAPMGAPMVQNAGPAFGEPPPPVPPGASDPDMNLAPLGGSSPEKLNLASPADTESPRSDAPASGKMYNLDSSSKLSGKRNVASSSKSEPKKSSTISKLAGKASSDQKAKESASSSGLSTINRLSKNASKEAEPEVAISQPEAKVETESLPVPKKMVAAEVSTEEPSNVLDTTMMAQPVRKGADSKSGSSGSSSDGPQSNATPGRNLFKDKSMPAIYPVSNPVVEQPVNIMEFS